MTLFPGYHLAELTPCTLCNHYLKQWWHRHWGLKNTRNFFYSKFTSLRIFIMSPAKLLFIFFPKGWNILTMCIRGITSNCTEMQLKSLVNMFLLRPIRNNEPSHIYWSFSLYGKSSLYPSNRCYGWSNSVGDIFVTGLSVLNYVVIVSSVWK